MWNWREFYQMVEQIKKYTRVLSSGESLVQIPQEESMGVPFLLHTISGKYQGNGAENSFCGYQTDQVQASRLVWLYLRKMPEGFVIFNTVFLRYGGKKQGIQLRERHGIRMVYRRMVQEQKTEKKDLKKEQNRKKMELFSMDVRFHRLVVIGSKEIEIRKATITELLNLFGRVADSNGMLVLVEQNARILCQGIEEKGQDIISKMI